MNISKTLIKKCMVMVIVPVLLAGCNNTKVGNGKDEVSRFGKYTKVIANEEPFFCFDWANGELTIEEYGEGIMAEGLPDIKKYAFVDIDGENGEELILYCPQGGGNYLILTEVEGKVYGTNKSYRGFENLQKDGKYSGSGGVGDSYYFTMKIGKDGVEEALFAEQHVNRADDGTVSINLVVDGVAVEDYEGWLAENYSDPVEWIEYKE